MPKRLILLAGLHKTATTAIQRTLARHRKQLDEAGFNYPVLTGSRFGTNHTGIFNTLFKRSLDRAGLQDQLSVTRSSSSEEDRQAFSEGFAELIAGSPGLIMAAEGVSVFSRDELRRLREWFEERGWQVVLVCHVRHLSAWLNSIVAQRVNSALRLSIVQVVNEFVQAGTLVRGRLENLRAEFPDARFHSYEQSIAYPGGPAAFFLHHAGIAVKAPVRTGRANLGGSDCATRAMSIVNEAFGSHLPGGSRNPRELRLPEVLGRLSKIEGRKFTLRPREAEPLLPLVLAENEWLRDTFGPEFHDPAPTFAPMPNEWSPQALRMLRNAIAAMPPEAREWITSNLTRLGIRPPPAGAAPRPLH